jgi:hypothetical protein
LKSRVSATWLSPGLLRLGLSAFEFGKQRARLIDIDLLPLLGSAHEEDDQLIPVLEPVTQSPVDPILAEPTSNPFDVRQVLRGFRGRPNC